MPSPTHTPLRNVRVPDELWQAAMARAAKENTTLSALINEWLQWYVDQPAPKKRTS